MIHVTPLSRLEETLAATGAEHLLSLLSAGTPFVPPSHLDPAKCLHLFMHDIVEEMPGLAAPSRAQVENIIGFARTWDRRSPLVVLCYAGISRSTAAAYVIAAGLQPEADERELAQALRALSLSATPNIRIVSLADQILARGGRMTEAVLAIGRGEDAFEGLPFAIPIG